MDQTRLVPKVKPIKFGNDVVWIDELLNMEYNEIGQAGELLTSAVAYLGWKRGDMVEAVINAEHAIKVAEQAADFRIRNEAKIAGTKVTEASITRMIDADAGVIGAVANYAKYKKSLGLCIDLVKALEAKMDFVRSGEATRRRCVDMEGRTEEELNGRRAARVLSERSGKNNNENEETT